MKRPSTDRMLALAVAGALMLTLGACSGGDGGGGTGVPMPAPLVLVPGSVSSANAAASAGIVLVSYQASGEPGSTYDLLVEYALQAGGPFLMATEVSSAAAAQLGLGANASALPGPGTTNLPIDANGMVDGRFRWNAVADLGGIARQGVVTRVTITETGMASATQSRETAGNTVDVASSLPTFNSAGAGAGRGPGMPAPEESGRAGHEAVAVGSPDGTGMPSLMVFGGANGTGGSNAFVEVSRFRFDPANFAHMALPAGMTDAKVLSASSLFLEEQTTGTTSSFLPRILVTGGSDRIALADEPELLARVGSSAVISNMAYVIEPGSSSTSGGSVARVIAMPSPLVGHTATWHPSNVVVIAGGFDPSAGATSSTGEISIFDPITNAISVARSSTGSVVTLNQPRVGHTTTLLGDGTMLVVGGYDPNGTSPAPALSAELISREAAGGWSATTVALPSAAILRVQHTATRLFNGWVLFTGGVNPFDASDIADTAAVFQPFGPSGTGTPTLAAIPMQQARTLHQATLLGTGAVMLSGGQFSPTRLAQVDGGGIARAFTDSVETFAPSSTAPMGFSFDVLNPLPTPRAEHSATAIGSGNVYVIAGRGLNSAGTTSFLDGIDFYAFSNAVPTVASAMTSGTSTTTTLGVAATFADDDESGGYVVIRWRLDGSTGAFNSATILSQTSAATTGTAPTMQVLPNQSYIFEWDFAADGLTSGDRAEVQIIPFGATIGSPSSIAVDIP